METNPAQHPEKMLKDPLGALVLSMTQEQIQRWTQVSAVTGSEVAVALHSLGKQSRRQLLGYSSNIVREEGTEIYLKPGGRFRQAV